MRAIFFAVWVSTVLVTGARGLGTTVIDGEAFIELIASVYTDVHENGTCYNVDSESMQNVEAIRWILTELNNNNYFSWKSNGKGIGLRVSMTCGSKAKAETLAYELSVELNSPGNKIIGVLGPEFSSEAEAVSRLLSALPARYRLLQLAASTTSASLRNRDIYTNFFRTIPADDIQTEVMTKFAESVNWTYMAIIYDDDAYGQGGKDALIHDTTLRDICFPAIIPVPMHGGNTLQYLESQIRDKIVNASAPVGGAIVFGSYMLASTVLRATASILADFPSTTMPTFLFSEAGGYLEGLETAIAKGIFVLSPPKKEVQSFQTHWRSLFTNIQNIYDLPADYRRWMMDVYQERFGCRLAELRADNTCPVVTDSLVREKIPPSVYNQYAIQASLIMAKVAKTAYQTKCQLNSNIDLCVNFFVDDRQDFIDIAQNLTVEFDNDFGNVRLGVFKNPDLVLSFSPEGEAKRSSEFPLYEIYNHQRCDNNNMCFVKAATLTSTGLDVFKDQIKDYDADGTENAWPDIRKPQCPDSHTCGTCLEGATTDTATFYKPGDLYVVGIVPVHSPGRTPLQCGDIKLGATDVVQVIDFAVSDAAQSYKEIIPSGKIGVIVIDSCNDPNIIQEKVLTLHRHGVLVDGQYVPVADKILGYIGGWSSSVSTVMADMTSRMGYVEISYASTASSLSDTLTYPYFLRTPTPDNYQADTMLKLVQTLGVNLIQIVHSKGTYGVGGRDTLVKLVDGYKICVANVHELTANKTNTDASRLITDLRKYPSARVVLLFISSFDADTAIKGLNDRLKPGEFIFIGSEGWGTRIDTSGYRNLQGSVTLTSELSVNEKFKDHMKGLRPDGTGNDPWIREYMEKVFDCYYQWSYDKKSGQPCQGTEKLDVFTTDYRIDAWASFAERAVLSLLQGAKLALDDECGGSNAICDAYRNNPQKLFDYTKVVEFTDGAVKARVFNNNGDGTAGYKIYAVGSSGQYIKVGSSELQGEQTEVNFQQGSYPGPANINSSCAGQAVCATCFPTPTPVDEKEDSLSAGLIVVIAILAVICCVLAAILLFVCNRLGCCLKLENGRPKLNENYITPVYLQRQPDGRNYPPAFDEHQENYDSINDMYHHRSGGGTSGGSYNRQPPIGGKGDSGISSGSRPSSNPHPSGGSYFSAGSSKSGGSNQSNSTSKGGYIQASRPAPHPPTRQGSRDNVQINQGGGMQRVVYQQDGSYITAPEGRENPGFDEEGEGQNVSDQSMRLPSTDSDKSLGYLRSVQVADL